MALFAMIGFDRHPHQMALRDKVRAEHREYVLGDTSKLKLAGAMLDDDGNQYGSLLVFEAENADEVWEWVRNEPFYKAGVFETLAIRRWDLVLGGIAPKAG